MGAISNLAFNIQHSAFSHNWRLTTTGNWLLTTGSMYLELHARSAFSFLEGASVPEELAEVCAAYQMPAMALLHRDGVYGAPRFHLAAKKLDIKAHIGAEITSLLPSYANDNGSPRAKALCSDVSVTGLKPGASTCAFTGAPRVPLLCASREGYQNLCRLVT